MAGGVFMSASHNPFLYETIMENPKLARPLHKVDDNTEYEVLHNNGFLRINTLRCRMYHIYQSRYRYQLPDWKIHFSIVHEDLPKAWNILSTLFMEKKCQSAIKVVVPDWDKFTWPNDMLGREITVYIYQHKKYYDDVEEYAPTSDMQQSRSLWLSFIETAEARLAEHKIQPLPHPEGDYPLGTYSSLRNEAFILLKPEWVDIVGKPQRALFNNGEYCYPPNVAGWNAAGHKNPLKNNLYAFLGQPIQAKLHRRSIKPILAEMHEDFKSAHAEMKVLSDQRKTKAMESVRQSVAIALEKPDTPDGQSLQSHPQQTPLNLPSSTILTANSSSFFSAASSSTASLPKDASISSLATKMAATLNDADSAKLFLSALTPETYELLKTAVQEKEFESEMRAAIQSMHQ
jgi:hypothetical protein